MTKKEVLLNKIASQLAKKSNQNKIRPILNKLVTDNLSDLIIRNRNKPVRLIDKVLNEVSDKYDIDINKVEQEVKNKITEVLNRKFERLIKEGSIDNLLDLIDDINNKISNKKQ